MNWGDITSWGFFLLLWGGDVVVEETPEESESRIPARSGHRGTTWG